MFMKKIAILCAVTLLSFFMLGFLPVHGEEKIYDSVIRLHVLANSDSEYDQNLKLMVRDRLLEADIFENAENLEDAEKAHQQAIKAMQEELAKSTIDEEEIRRLEAMARFSIAQKLAKNNRH